MAKRADFRRLHAWLAVALWTALILTLSGDTFSASSTSRFLGPFLRWLFPDISAETLQSVHYLVRKCAHVTEYGLLALLTLRAELAAATGLRGAALARVLGLTAVVASVDELRQARLEERTGSPFDVGLDLAGGVAALALALCARQWTRRRRGVA